MGGQKKKMVKKFIIFEGLILSLVGWMIMMWTFFTAYFNPTKTVLIDINSIGEANLEAIAIPIVFLICCYSVYEIIKTYLWEQK